ncbi:MAG: preprotein translocase subunit SecG [Phycisphaerales bacterium]|nr:preprotein translocase subunit SecG [Phycisphaerales bacterium]
MWFQLLIVLFILASVALVLVILVQRPQGGGLAQAFGGASGGGTDTAFGGRTGDVLTYLTMGAFVTYLLIAIGLNVMDPTGTTTPAATEEQVIEPGLLPPVDAAGAVTTPKVPASAPAPNSPEPVRTLDQPLTAPATIPTPAPAQTPAPAGGAP